MIKKMQLNNNKQEKEKQMKSQCWKTIGGLSLAILMSVIFAPYSVLAQGSSGGQSGGGRLEGTWVTQVTVRNCQTGSVIRTFQSLTTFISGGTMIDSTSGIPQALKTPGQGVWSHVNGDTYSYSFGSFGFDPMGKFTGATKITGKARLNSTATELVSSAITNIYDTDGNLVTTLCPTTTATRFE